MFERRRLRVYVAGPISKGDVFENVTNGIRWGRKMLEDGLAPYVPHLDAYLTLNAAAPPPVEGEESPLWRSLLEWDLEWVAASEAVFRIHGESKGADLECRMAEELGIPVFREDEYEEGFGWGYASLLRFARYEKGLAGVRV